MLSTGCLVWYKVFYHFGKYNLSSNFCSLIFPTLSVLLFPSLTFCSFLCIFQPLSFLVFLLPLPLWVQQVNHSIEFFISIKIFLFLKVLIVFFKYNSYFIYSVFLIYPYFYFFKCILCAYFIVCINANN